MTEPAEATLACLLFDARTGEIAGTKKRKRERISTSCKIVDNVLQGGFDYGQVCCISGETGTGKSAIYLNTLAYHLLSSPYAQAAVIDVSGSFNVLKLHHVLLHQCKKFELLSVDATAEEALDRVRVMRVFDIVGVSESINEVKHELDNTPNHELSSPTSPSQPQRKTTIDDSEEEGEVYEVLYDEHMQARMLGNLAHPTDGTVPRPSSPWMIVVDNLAQLISPLIRSSYVQGQALLSTLLRSLAVLSSTRCICTILINSTILTTTSAVGTRTPKSAALSRTPSNDKSAAQDASIDSPSIFTSNLAKPALGDSLANCVDLHVMTSQMPKTKDDAQALSIEAAHQGLARATMVNILEVLSSRHDGRTGRWGTFTVEIGPVLKDGAA